MAMRISGLVSGLDTDAIVQELVSAYSKKSEKYTKEQTKISWKQEIWKNLNSKIYSLYTGLDSLRFSSGYASKKASASDATKATVTASGNAVNGTQKLNVLETAETGYMTGGKVKMPAAGSSSAASDPLNTRLRDLGYDGDAASFKVKTKSADGTEKTTVVSFDRGSTINDITAKLKEAGLNASFDTKQNRFYISSKESGAASDFEISAYSGDENSLKALSVLGLNTEASAYGEQAVKLAGRDARITLNGVEYTSSSNSFDINGLTITAQAVTGAGDDNAVTLTTATDTQAIYDKIKDFLTEYNNVINEITKLYNADSARDYEPLTDEEKDAMSDTEIEKWETKIKDSLLRRDSTLDSVMSSMINAMASSVEIDGKSYSFSSFGIHTLGYLNAPENEFNAFHIDGDADDANTSSNPDKLMAAINNDPDTLISFMQQMTSKLYTAIDEKMKSTSLSSAYKVYNDKELDKQYSNYAKLIKNWDKKVSDKEEYYYKKFSAMESAMAQLQSQTNSLTSLFGQ